MEKVTFRSCMTNNSVPNFFQNQLRFARLASQIQMVMFYALRCENVKPSEARLIKHCVPKPLFLERIIATRCFAIQFQNAQIIKNVLLRMVNNTRRKCTKL